MAMTEKVDTPPDLRVYAWVLMDSHEIVFPNPKPQRNSWPYAHVYQDGDGPFAVWDFRELPADAERLVRLSQALLRIRQVEEERDAVLAECKRLRADVRSALTPAEGGDRCG